jgi:hypothetical protein
VLKALLSSIELLAVERMATRVTIAKARAHSSTSTRVGDATSERAVAVANMTPTMMTEPIVLRRATVSSSGMIIPLRLIVMRYSSLETVKKRTVAAAKLIHG